MNIVVSYVGTMTQFENPADDETWSVALLRFLNAEETLPKGIYSRITSIYCNKIMDDSISFSLILFLVTQKLTKQLRYK